mgnify:CR=1 FL=1
MPRYQDICCYNTTCARMIDYICMGSCSWTVPANVTYATFEIWGGGGGGGGHCCCNCFHGGAGGASGGYARTSVTVTPGDTYTICVGGGGMQCIGGACGYHWCCYGNPGCTTYVTGTNLSNFCATGGDGGTNDCFAYCGCMTGPGRGYGGCVIQCGTAGIAGGTSAVPCMQFWGTGGSPAYTSSTRFFVNEQCTGCHIAAYGIFPGGGGATVSNNCCCCSQGGVGANGMVRIYY